MRAFAIIFCCLLFGSEALAHTRSQSASNWQIIDQTLVGTFSVDSRRATLLYGAESPEDAALGDILAAHLQATVSAAQAGAPCPMSGPPRPLAAEEGYERFELRFECPAPIMVQGAQLSIGAFFPVSASHLHIVRVSQGSDILFEGVLTETNRVVRFGSGQTTPGNRLSSFFATGFWHVLSGWDHLAFLAALLLLARRFKPIVLTLTGFTIGHSATMALVALGFLRPHGLAIEVLIGFSIAYAALEAGAGDMEPRHRSLLWIVFASIAILLGIFGLAGGVSWPPAMALIALSFFALSRALPSTTKPEFFVWRGPVLALIFGLAHGAGFAGALLDYDLGGQGLLWSLLGFNLGVEGGQVAAVFVMLIGAFVFMRFAPKSEAGWAVPISAAALFALGVFWTTARFFQGL